VIPAAPVLPVGRAAGRRGAAAINYAEIDGYDEDDYDDDGEIKKRPTGLRSLRRGEEPNAGTPTIQPPALGKEADKPVAVQGIWRDWMGKQGRLVYVLNNLRECMRQRQNIDFSNAGQRSNYTYKMPFH